MLVMHDVTRHPTRKVDKWGSGQFQAARGGHAHQGLDLQASPGEKILSPIDGTVVRDAFPYKDSSEYTGVLIRGTGEWLGYEVKIFYVNGLSCGPVKAGDNIGFAQNVAKRYPGITNHVHLEIRYLQQVKNPLDFFLRCF